MKKLTLSLFFLASLNLMAVDPVQDYLSINTFPTKNTKYDGQLFSGEQWDGDHHQLPPGGYLFRFDAPIGLNGTTVTFVATSLRVSMRGSTWSAYEIESHNNLILLSDQASLSNFNLYLAPATADRGPMLSEVTSNKTSIFIKAFYFDSSRKWIEGSVGSVPRDFTKEDADPHYGIIEIQNLVRAKQLGVSFAPKIEKILLAEYLKNPSSKWRICKDSHIYGQHTDPDEKEHLRAAKNFRKEDAVQLWKAIEPTPK